VKLIAEPWDVGEGGYQVGNFPPQWAEWNGRYRDDVRDVWRGAQVGVGELAQRLTGSSDLYESDARHPHASINFVTAHDGFTLADLTSYDERHNEANGEDGNDGEGFNRSWSCGVEGPTDDPEVLELRARQRRNLLTTLLLSQGVPMLLGGDELGRTQQGNNNAYCQDNEISWYDWDAVDEPLLDFTRQLVAYRQAHPVFRRRRFFQGRPIRTSSADGGPALPDIAWFGPAGTEMTDEQWEASDDHLLMVFLNGDLVEVGRRGEPVVDDRLLLVLNGDPDACDVVLPPEVYGARWCLDLDTHAGTIGELVDAGEPAAAGSTLPVPGRTVLVLRAVDG
jgi:glycogen operon protein